MPDFRTESPVVYAENGDNFDTIHFFSTAQISTWMHCRQTMAFSPVDSKYNTHQTMKHSFFLLTTALAHTALLAAPATISLDPISTVRNGDAAEIFAQSAAEIVKFDSVTKRMFVVNGSTDSIDIFDATNPAAPVFLKSVNLSELGNPNSVDVNPNAKANEIAVAVSAPDAAQRGNVVFLNKQGDILQTIQVGYLPDMLTYNLKGGRLVVANEGEPNADYSIDPEGSVSIIDIDGRRRTHKEVTFSKLTLADVPGVRITGPAGTTVAQDLEPEFVAIEGNIAYVTCQENNAVAKINLSKKRLETILPLGSINHAELGNAIDTSDKDSMIRIANWPVRGLLMPDGIATYTASERGKRSTYFVTANEGDSRERTGYIDEARVKTRSLDPSAFPLAAELKADANMGRLTIVSTEGKIEGQSVHQELYSFGARSFSIFDENGTMVYDSGSMIETYLAENFPDNFNCAHDESGAFDSRSDNKGAEPEAIEIGVIDGRTYAFVGLERFSGILVCDITNPRDVKFAGFGLNRDFSVNYDEDNLGNVAAAGDLGPEGLDFVPATKSPNGKPLLVVANEVSGTTTIYQISAMAP
jgi:DNA-binding beta-propeller fold protein YncE